MKDLPVIVIDTREQDPFPLVGYKTVRATLKTGDYSLQGYEDRVAVERKSKGDAYGCVGASRKRFEECLVRLAAMEAPLIVIEEALTPFAQPPSWTRIDARMAVGSYLSWQCRYRIPVNWCDGRAAAERVMVRHMAAFLKYRAGK